MTVAHVVASLDPRHGGPSKAVPALAQAQARLGHRVELFTTGPVVHTERAGSLTIHTMRRGWPEKLCPAPGLSARIRAAAPEVVHAHGLWLRTLHHAHRAARRLGVPLVISPRGMMTPWAWRHHRWRKQLASACLHPGAISAAGGWQVGSASEARDLHERGLAAPICVAPHGVEAPAESELADARTHWHEALPISRHRPTALFYSRLHPKKRVIELIDLWLALAPPSWGLLVVGIPEKYSVYQIRNYVARQGGGDRVDVFDGAHRPAPYAVASLCLLPSHSENFGLVVAEALAAGVPALVTDSTPWASLPAQGAGWWVPWERYGEALAAALRESPGDLRARGERGRHWARAQFSWGVTAQTVLDFYRQLGASPRRP